jgi:hypothetical protein
VNTGPAQGEIRRADYANRQSIPDSGSYADVAMDANAVYNPITGPAPSGMTGWQTSFEHKMRKRAKKKQREERWRRWFGKGH